MKLDPEESPFDLIDRTQFLNVSSFFYFLIILFALFLGWLVECNPLEYLHWDLKAVLIGIVATIPLLVYLYFSIKSEFKAFNYIREFLVESLGPLLCKYDWWELFGLSLIVGFGEELLFRGVLQHWMTWYGPGMALVFSNIIFGLAHPHSKGYVVMVFLVGLYLGGCLYLTEDQNLLVPMITHALYDFIAFLVIKKMYINRQQGSSNTDID